MAAKIGALFHVSDSECFATYFYINMISISQTAIRLASRKITCTLCFWVWLIYKYSSVLENKVVISKPRKTIKVLGLHPSHHERMNRVWHFLQYIVCRWNVTPIRINNGPVPHFTASFQSIYTWFHRSQERCIDPSSMEFNCICSLMTFNFALGTCSRAVAQSNQQAK